MTDTISPLLLVPIIGYMASLCQPFVSFILRLMIPAGRSMYSSNSSVSVISSGSSEGLIRKYLRISHTAPYTESVLFSESIMIFSTLTRLTIFATASVNISLSFSTLCFICSSNQFIFTFLFFYENHTCSHYSEVTSSSYFPCFSISSS